MQGFIAAVIAIVTWVSTHWKELGAAIAAIVLIIQHDPAGWPTFLQALMVLFLGASAVANKSKLAEIRKELDATDPKP